MPSNPYCIDKVVMPMSLFINKVFIFLHIILKANSDLLDFLLSLRFPARYLVLIILS